MSDRGTKRLIMPLIIPPRYPACPATEKKRYFKCPIWGKNTQKDSKEGGNSPKKQGEKPGEHLRRWGDVVLLSWEGSGVPGGGILPPSPLPAHRCLCPPPPGLNELQTAFVLANLIETSHGVQGLGGGGRTDRAPPEPPSGWKLK